MSAFSELVVLETAQHVAGPYCGKLLADRGADVIKVEPPHGDVSRFRGPFPDGAPDADASGAFIHLNANKRSVVVDLEDPAFLRLAARAGLVIDDGALSPERLLEANPALVVVEIAGFGFDGPYAGFELTDYAAYAASAWMAAMGDPGRAPLYPGVDYPFYVAGLYAAFGALAALRHARATGEGQVVRVSTLDAAISVDFYETTKYAYRGKLRQRDGHMITGVAASVQPCRDGHVALTFAGETDWRAFTEVIGAPELAEGEFATATDRLLHTDRLNRRLQEVLGRLSVDEVVRGSQERHVAVTRVATTRDVYASEQLRARDWFATVEHPVGGTVEHPGPPFRLESPGWQLARPAPRLGEHTCEVLG